MKIINGILFCVFFFSLNAIAQPGAIDTKFGIEGFVYYNTEIGDGFETMGIQPDGKLIVHRQFYLGRYNTNGTLDISFGTNGWKSLNHGLLDLVIQADGSILTLVQTASSGNRIFKHNANDGSIDVNWGDGGSVGIELFGVQLSYKSIALDTKGRIILAGQATFGTSPNITRTTSVARLNADGSLDTGFNGGGIRNQIFLDNLDRSAIECGVDGNDKIVISVGVGRTVDDDIILKYNTDGRLDLTFGGGDGEITSAEKIIRLVVDVSGKIGYTTEARPNALVWSQILYLNSDGTGITNRFFQQLIAFTAIDFQDDGKIVFAGFSAGRLVVIRLNSDGDEDETFYNGTAVGRIDILPGSNIVPTEVFYYNKRLFFSGHSGV
ncbi:MAG: hypothetical protein ABIU11_04010, partial [Chitinophagaceae bacterium]